MKKRKITVSLRAIIAMVLMFVGIVMLGMSIIASAEEGKRISELWPLSDETINIGTFTNPTSTSLGSVADYAVFSRYYDKSMHIEGTLATEVISFNGKDKIGVTDGVLQYIDPNENIIYIGGVAGDTISDFDGTNQIRNSIFLWPDNVNFVKEYETYDGSSWNAHQINNGNGVVFELNGVFSSEFNNFEEVEESVRHIGETTYHIDFDSAFEALRNYSASKYAKRTNPEKTRIVRTESAITIECSEGIENVVELTPEEIINKDISITCRNSGGQYSQNFSLMANIVNVTGDVTFNKEISINGVTNDAYGPTAGRLMWNFGPNYNGTATFQETKLGMILAPNASVFIDGVTHSGSVWARRVKNERAEIHQNRYKEFEEIDINLTKVWNDCEDQDKRRPSQVEVKLFANGVEQETKIIKEEDGWKGKFTGLPKYGDNGQIINYEVREVGVEGYTTEVRKISEEGFLLTNSHDPARISIAIIKNWDDNNNAGGTRPDKITLILYADGVEKTRKDVTESDDWTTVFADLPKYVQGVEINYTVKEVPIRGYTSNIQGNMLNGYVIENKVIPDEIKVVPTIEVKGEVTETPTPTPTIPPTKTPTPTVTQPEKVVIKEEKPKAILPQTGESRSLAIGGITCIVISAIMMAGTIKKDIFGK